MKGARGEVFSSGLVVLVTSFSDGTLLTFPAVGCLTLLYFLVK